jgi:hypothetical protein
LESEAGEEYYLYSEVDFSLCNFDYFQVVVIALYNGSQVIHCIRIMLVESTNTDKHVNPISLPLLCP